MNVKEQLNFIKKTKYNILKFFKNNRIMIDDGEIEIPLFNIYAHEIIKIINNLYENKFFNYIEDYKKLIDFIEILERWSISYNYHY